MFHLFQRPYFPISNGLPKKNLCPPKPLNTGGLFFGGKRFPPPKTKSRGTLSVTFSSLRSFCAFSRTSRSVRLGGIIGMAGEGRWEKKTLGKEGDEKLVTNSSCAQIKGSNLAYIMIHQRFTLQKQIIWEMVVFLVLSGEQNGTSSQPNIFNKFQRSNSFSLLNCFPIIFPIAVALPRVPTKKFDNRQFFGFRGDLHPSQAPPKNNQESFFGFGKI